MLALGRINTLGYSVLSFNICICGFPESSLSEEINRLGKGIDGANLSIMSHFSTEECVESLSEDLKWVLLEVQGAVDRIWDHFNSREGTLSSKDLRSLLDEAFNYLNYLREGCGLEKKFRPSFVNVKKYINDVYSVVTKIRDHVNNVKDEKSISSCEDIKKKISVIYVRIEGLQQKIGICY
jgi:hypothetical protein